MCLHVLICMHSAVYLHGFPCVRHPYPCLLYVHVSSPSPGAVNNTMPCTRHHSHNSKVYFPTLSLLPFSSCETTVAEDIWLSEFREVCMSQSVSYIDRPVMAAAEDVS